MSSGARVAVAPRAGGKKRKGAHATAEASAVDGTPAAAAAAAAVTTAALAGGGGEGSVAGAGAPAAAVVDYCGSGIDDRPAGEEPSPLSAMHPPLRTLLADSACCWRDTHCASNRAVGSPRMSLTFELQMLLPFYGLCAKLRLHARDSLVIHCLLIRLAAIPLMRSHAHPSGNAGTAFLIPR